jgi:glyceraldehyde 3-phosphate dehydrogenase
MIRPMTVRVAINGFGRIGRHFYRAVRASQAAARRDGVAGPEILVVAANELAPARTVAHLLTFDSTHRRFDLPVELTEHGIDVGGEEVLLYAEPEPKALPWADLGVDIVVECTGRFRKRAEAAAHLDAGAHRVVISSPSKDADATFVVGVNEDTYDPEQHVVVSNASCTTNCFVPMVKVLDDAFGVRNGFMTTVHAYTNDQQLLDLTHKDLRRSRAAAVNIIPAETGAARATGLVMSSLQGRLDGTALRVPVQDGSITDFTAIINGEVDVAEVNAAFLAASRSGRLARVLEYTEEPIVSSDVIGSRASCLFDAGMTMTMPLDGGGTLVKVFGWYDNEWGYSNRLVDLVAIIGAR